MIHKTLLATALALTALGVSAQASAPVNAHKANEQKVRECRKQAAVQQLTGEDRRAFIAACVKKDG